MPLVFDVDNVLALGGKPYEACEVSEEAREALRTLQNEGFRIILATARYMKQCGGDKEEAEATGRAELIRWLDYHGVPYDEVHFGKPSGLCYFDDRAYLIDSSLPNPAEQWEKAIEYARSLREQD